MLKEILSFSVNEQVLQFRAWKLLSIHRKQVGIRLLIRLCKWMLVETESIPVIDLSRLPAVHMFDWTCHLHWDFHDTLARLRNRMRRCDVKSAQPASRLIINDNICASIKRAVCFHIEEPLISRLMQMDTSLM